MRPLTKRLLGAVALLALVLLSAFGAGTYGFMQGYVHGLGDTSSEAATLTTTLRALRSGDVEKAMTNLEGDLDTLIIEHSVTDTGIPVFSWLTPYTHNDAAERKLFTRVARYRDEYPSVAPVPEVRTLIAKHLESFQTQ